VREKIPFGPKVSICDCLETYFWISPEEFAVEKEVKLSKIPYCDCFTARTLMIVAKVAGNSMTTTADCSTKITYKTYINFIKSTMFKSRIISGSLAENTEYWKDVFVPQARLEIVRYVKNNAPQRPLRVE